MTCTYCVTAHQRGRFWFCNRCGGLVASRVRDVVRARSHGDAVVPSAGASVRRATEPGGRFRVGRTHGGNPPASPFLRALTSEAAVR